MDGEEGKADGSSDKNDKKDDEEEEGGSGEVDSSSGEESSSPAVVRPRPLPCCRNPNVLTSTDSSGSSSYSSDSSSSGSSSDCRSPDSWPCTDHAQISLFHSPTPPKCSTRAIVALINNLGIVYHQYCSSSYLDHPANPGSLTALGNGNQARA